VEFYGFADKDRMLIDDEVITTPPVYMLVKLKHDVGIQIALPGLPSSVVGIEPVETTYRPTTGKGKVVTFFQFPVSLAYAITDYKCPDIPMGHCGSEETRCIFSKFLPVCSIISSKNCLLFINSSSFYPC
jgi:hypothetical protein